MRRAWFVAAIALLGFTQNASTAPQQKGHDVRWDLIQFVQNTAIAGTNVGRDTASGDTVSLTGSGDAEPAEKVAAGGGTFVHRHANGTEVLHGVYVVTGFMDWQPAGGTLAGLGLTDGIGHIDETSGGILTLAVRLFPSGGGHEDGVLIVNCNLPGVAFDIEEGIGLDIGGFHFVQAGGFTLFHVQK